MQLLRPVLPGTALECQTPNVLTPRMLNRVSMVMVWGFGSALRSVSVLPVHLCYSINASSPPILTVEPRTGLVNCSQFSPWPIPLGGRVTYLFFVDQVMVFSVFTPLVA